MSRLMLLQQQYASGINADVGHGADTMIGANAEVGTIPLSGEPVLLIQTHAI